MNAGETTTPDPDPKEVERWKLMGYAPGGYLCTCLRCSATFEGDKRAVECLPCAAKQASALLTAKDEEIARLKGDGLTFDEGFKRGREHEREQLAVRVDTLANELLDERLERAEARAEKAEALLRRAEAAAGSWVTWTKPIRYGAWRIYRNEFTAHPDWGSVAWLYTHEDYDGPEDNRNGFAATIEACIADIQEREEDQ